MPDETSPDEAKLWQEAKTALNSGEETRAIALFERLAKDGDWRASTSIALILEAKGAQDPRFFIQAAHWYNNALAKEDRVEPRLGLARYYYYGLGGTKDYKLAIQHLVNASPELKPEAALMLATLFYLGPEKSQIDIEKAKKYYRLACEAGYPLAMQHLSRIALSEGHLLEALRLGIRGIATLIRLRLNNDRDPKLIGFLRSGTYPDKADSKRGKSMDPK